MKKILTGIKGISLLVLGPVLAWGYWGFDFRGGLLNCPFPIPFILCHICPIPCTVRSWGAGMFSGLVGGNLLLGRFFCGVWCPLGSAHDFFSKLPAKKIRLPHNVDSSLKPLKYVIAFIAALLIIEIVLWQGIPLIERLWFFLSYYSNYFLLIILTLIGLSLLLAPFISRVWCRYLCPVGVWTSLFNRYSLVGMKLKPGLCHACLDCARNCPAKLSFPPKEWESSDCFRCLQCYTECKDKAIGFKLKVGG